MENTLEKKATLFAQYWGQEVIEDVNNSVDKVIYPATGSNMYRFEESTLILKALSSITDEDYYELMLKRYPIQPFSSFKRDKMFVVHFICSIA